MFDFAYEKPKAIILEFLKTTPAVPYKVLRKQLPEKHRHNLDVYLYELIEARLVRTKHRYTPPIFLSGIGFRLHLVNEFHHNEFMFGV